LTEEAREEGFGSVAGSSMVRENRAVDGRRHRGLWNVAGGGRSDERSRADRRRREEGFWSVAGGGSGREQSC
jgi:hypothetical protein